jgi:hypothetical protein
MSLPNSALMTDAYLALRASFGAAKRERSVALLDGVRTTQANS